MWSISGVSFLLGSLYVYTPGLAVKKLYYFTVHIHMYYNVGCRNRPLTKNTRGNEVCTENRIKLGGALLCAYMYIFWGVNQYSY